MTRILLFTTAALAMLVDEGKLRWDDRVIDHIPELRLYDRRWPSSDMLAPTPTRRSEPSM